MSHSRTSVLAPAGVSIENSSVSNVASPLKFGSVESDTQVKMFVRVPSMTTLNAPVWLAGTSGRQLESNRTTTLSSTMFEMSIGAELRMALNCGFSPKPAKSSWASASATNDVPFGPTLLFQLARPPWSPCWSSHAAVSQSVQPKYSSWLPAGVPRVSSAHPVRKPLAWAVATFVLSVSSTPSEAMSLSCSGMPSKSSEKITWA